MPCLTWLLLGLVHRAYKFQFELKTEARVLSYINPDQGHWPCAGLHAPAVVMAICKSDETEIAGTSGVWAAQARWAVVTTGPCSTKLGSVSLTSDLGSI